MSTYPSAVFAQLAPSRTRGVRTWRRKFACPNPACELRRREMGARGGRRLGRQTIREYLDPEDGYRVSGYGVERVELGRDLIPLPDLPDGTLHFGPPSRVRRQSPTPGQPMRSPLRRAIPVLASVDALNQVGRHDRSRARGGTGPFLSLALSRAKAARPFVVTCPECRQRCLVEGALATSAAFDAQPGPR